MVMKPDRKHLDSWLNGNREECLRAKIKAAEAIRTNKPVDIHEFIDAELDAMFGLDTNKKPKKGQEK